MATAFTAGGTFVVGIVVANLLGREDFGRFSILRSTLLTVTALAPLATGLTATKFVAEFRAVQKAKAGRILGMCARICSAGGLTAAGALLLLAPWLSRDVLKSDALTEPLRWSGAAALFLVLSAFQSGMLSGLEAFRVLAFNAVASGCLHVVLVGVGGLMNGVVYVQREALPFVPFSIEKALLRRPMRLVVDYDDAIYVRYRRHPLWIVRTLLRDKLERLIAMADCVIVANRTLAAWAAQRARSVRLVPTSVDLSRYPPRRTRREETDIPIVAWIGTPVTVRYLETIAGALQKLQARHAFRLRVIGASRVTLSGVLVETVEWREETEVAALQGSDIGIMPLPDDEWTRGKSALKLLQYMAAGLPSVAAAVGTSLEIVQDGVNGFLAASEEDWIEKLAALIGDVALRERTAAPGLQTVREGYSLAVNVGPWLNALVGNGSGGEGQEANRA